jgi:hypothetical protein
MPYTLKVEGMEEITAMLAKAEGAAQGIAALALYDGAGVVADEISRGARGISTIPFRYAAGGRMRDPSPEEKEALISAGAAGIAKFDKTGNEVNTSVGYNRSGYVSIKGKIKPVAVIANAINSGTSFMKKQPFIRNARDKAKDQATEVITQKVTSLVEEILK